MTRDELREKALLAFAHAGGLGIIPDDGEKWDEDIANGMDAAIALVLEEAALVADDKMAELVSNLQNSYPYNMNSYAAHSHSICVAKDIAAAIRKLKEVSDE